jgi:mono/diheme cytochrome c family protein
MITFTGKRRCKEWHHTDRFIVRRIMGRPLVSALFIATIAATVAGAQSTQPRTPPPLALESLTGRDSFELYCASCHGANGTGNGPVASALRTPPADLTLLSRRNGGAFSRERVAAFVEGSGRTVPAHGSGEMPVWGPIFRGLEASDARTKVRLNNLVAYLESLQRVEAAAAPTRSSRISGAELFRSYCASCHGDNASGNGPLAGQLRRSPPDLTHYAARNGDVFPSERLRRIIDGRDVGAHGDRTMPVWGDVFRRQQGPGDDSAAARIDALVEFLRSIQGRAAH